MSPNSRTTLAASVSLAIVLLLQGCTTRPAPPADRIAARDYPSVFQAWYGIDMPEVPISDPADRLRAAARHDVIWEEALSQLGEGADLVLGVVWDHRHKGLGTGFTPESHKLALANRRTLLGHNPNLIMLMEIRWRDAPRDFLPADSDWWLRDANGQPVVGWTGGWIPFWMLNYENPAFQDNVARQARIAIESGVFDGIMLDWSGHPDIVRKVREAIGEEALIIVNIHDHIEDGQRYAQWINGSFMECNPQDATSVERNNRTTWDSLRAGLIWFEQNLRQPTLNCLEVWGDRKDLSRMRATTTLGLVYGNCSVLYGDPNPLKTPDHLHDWYGFWDAPLGSPAGGAQARADGAVQREYTGGTVVYNHDGNAAVTVSFPQDRVRASDRLRGRVFTVNGRDGDIFLYP